MADLSASAIATAASDHQKEAADLRLNPSAILGAAPHDYWVLLKPRVMVLVVFTALVGLLRAPGELHPFLAIVAIFAIAIGAGASGAFNMGYDVDIDRVMTRTQKRPTARGVVSVPNAYGFASILSVFSVVVLGLAVNWWAAALLAFTIWFYAVVYTIWLKRATPQNIVIGGAAGAFPPMIGWLAMSGGLTLEPILLFLIIFFWTPPHFWALALLKVDDYANASIPMLPNVAGVRTTQIHILLYSFVLAAVAIAPYAIGFTGHIYGIVSVVFNIYFVYSAYKIFIANEFEPEILRPACRKLFTFSILYLFVLFLTLLIDVYLPTPFGSML